MDPTIFERSFARTVGLARLLVLEQLPKPGDRKEYLDQRRTERGRPKANTFYRSRRSLKDNVKDHDPDDVPEWVHDDAISNYHSFTVPYGPKYHAKKIEKLLYTKDLLLNAGKRKSHVPCLTITDAAPFQSGTEIRTGRSTFIDTHVSSDPLALSYKTAVALVLNLRPMKSEKLQKKKARSTYLGT